MRTSAAAVRSEESGGLKPTAHFSTEIPVVAGADVSFEKQIASAHRAIRGSNLGPSPSLTAHIAEDGQRHGQEIHESQGAGDH